MTNILLSKYMCIPLQKTFQYFLFQIISTHLKKKSAIAVKQILHTTPGQKNWTRETEKLLARKKQNRNKQKMVFQFKVFLIVRMFINAADKFQNF